jgi:hypothetical protein
MPSVPWPLAQASSGFPPMMCQRAYGHRAEKGFVSEGECSGSSTLMASRSPARIRASPGLSSAVLTLGANNLRAIRIRPD